MVFVPLWFLGVYTAIVLLTPITMRWHERAPVRALAGLAAAVVAIDVIRFALPFDVIGYVNVLFVFLFVHQLGYWYGDGTLTRCSRRVHWCMVGGAAAALAILTTCGPYPVSMVTVNSEAGSNMLPPTVCIAAARRAAGRARVAAAPRAQPVARSAGPWKIVVSANVFAMTVFTWHMTAYVLAVGCLRPLRRSSWLAHPTVGLVARTSVVAAGAGLLPGRS